VALHHLDAPWRPADIEQREGRILRQGNTNANGRENRVNRYVTEGSFDAYMWQTLETKAKFISQVMTGRDRWRGGSRTWIHPHSRMPR
jgi:SNF2 family DNA or RNA helicase